MPKKEKQDIKTISVIQFDLLYKKTILLFKHNFRIDTLQGRHHKNKMSMNVLMANKKSGFCQLFSGISSLILHLTLFDLKYSALKQRKLNCKHYILVVDGMVVNVLFLFSDFLHTFLNHTVIFRAQ